ncbi:MAG TPA: YwqG family protein [Thermomonospora sp.]|nr:YwqG family protein [Thermomonospora sp.]
MDWIVTERQRLHHLFGVYLAPEVSAAIVPLARPALRLGGEGKAVRFGGRPMLPPSADWPRWAGRPLDFLALVDFGELSAVLRQPGVPQEGQAAFYYASGAPRPWGASPEERDGWRVYTGELVETDPPPGVTTSPPRTLGAAPFLSLPAPQEPVLQRVEAGYDGILPVYEQLYAAWLHHLWPDDPVHQIGGWPVIVQRPVPAEDRAAAPALPAPPVGPGDWCHLLQLDSDDRVGWHWGDPGRVFFCHRASAPLEDTWLILQAQ